MSFEGRALYNLIQLNLKPDAESTLLSGEKLESWQTDNYRNKPTESLIQGLQQLNIPFDLTQFEQWTRHYDTPEELTDTLVGNQKPYIQEKAYLLVFELWRRLCHEKQSLSIFCDELDYQITLYDRGETHSPSDIHDILASLLKVLNDNVDQGATPEAAFSLLQSYTANDLESFLYDFIFEELEGGDRAYAEDLLESFTRYMNDKKWFQLLTIEIEITRDHTAGALKLKELIKEAEQRPQLSFDLEILHFLSKHGGRNLFFHLAHHALTLISTEEEFEDFLAIAAAFFHSIDWEEKEHTIQNLMMKRLERVKGVLKKSDPDLIALSKIFKEAQKEHSTVEAHPGF
jgi:hypothetical protein